MVQGVNLVSYDLAILDLGFLDGKFFIYDSPERELVTLTSLFYLCRFLFISLKEWAGEIGNVAETGSGGAAEPSISDVCYRGYWLCTTYDWRILDILNINMI